MPSKLTSIQNLQNLKNLERFVANNHAFDHVDLSGMTELSMVSICRASGSDDPPLRSVNVAGCVNLESLELNDNDFSLGFPNLSGLDTLNYISFISCGIAEPLDLSGLIGLRSFDLSDNEDLIEVSISKSQDLDDVTLSGCNLNEETVDRILTDLSDNGVSDGYVNLGRGTNSPPGPDGLAAKEALEDDGWEVEVNVAVPAYATIAADTDFDISGDFTIEAFINTSNLDGFPRVYSFGTYPAANAISIENGTTMYFWANNAILLSGSFSPDRGRWYHIAVMAKGANVYMFVDGVRIANSSYGGSISSQGESLSIGYGNERYTSLSGLITNFRWSNHAQYNTEAFPVPTAPLTNTPSSLVKLLIFQGETTGELLIDNSGNGHDAEDGGTSKLAYSGNNPFAGELGSIRTGEAISAYPFMMGVSEFASAQACGRRQENSTLCYLAGETPKIGEAIYSDPSLTTPAQNGWYAYINSAYEIDNGDGLILNVVSCS